MKFANETAFTNAVIELATMAGWRVHHDRMKQNVQGHAGFPDLCMAKGGRVIFAELKMPGKPLEPDQDLWYRALAQGDGDWYIWQPQNWDFIVRKLTER